MPIRITPVGLVADTLALALVASSDAPLVLLDGQLTVVAASTSFCRRFQIDPATIRGLEFFSMGGGAWDVPQLRSLLKATLTGKADLDAYEMDLKRQGGPPRRLVLKAHVLDYDDPGNLRMMVTIADVTEARIAEKLKDDLVREKAVLLEELQHRVANSLQIIASVLMQSARKTPSDEVRTHLRDAHNRVMSVAALQRQLAVSKVGEVDLRAYFNELCESIGASMIHDHSQLSIAVEADDSVTSAERSVSLGLIVTELVINALKHAFPGDRAGNIVVGYVAEGRDWKLSVTDDGVGMPNDPASAKAGLGTSIVEALARQLEALVTVVNLDPGTTVDVTHIDTGEAITPKPAV